MSNRNAGFSLLELAVVVTVISLIVGSILFGVAMIKNAQLQSAMADIDIYTKAFQNFKDKYHELPGDFDSAESFWGSDTACPNTVYTVTPHTKTCNGNGDGRIGNHTDNSTTDYEMFRAWQQLSDAALIRPTFSGMSGTANSYNSVIGINVPATQYPAGGFFVEYVHVSNFAADTTFFLADYGHIIGLGAATNGINDNPLLTPREAFMVDSKIDDGLPAFGNVLTTKSAVTPNCTTSDTAAVSRYNTGYTTAACNLLVITGF